MPETNWLVMFEDKLETQVKSKEESNWVTFEYKNTEINLIKMKIDF